MVHSLQIQSVLYHNEKFALLRALKSLANAIEVNRRTTAELSSVTVCYGDASSSPVFSQQEVEEITAQFANAFRFSYTYFNENTGSARGHNLLGATCESEYMLIMNPDVIVCPRFFYGMFEPFLRENSDCGMTEGRQSPVEHPKEYNKKTLETEWATTACAMFKKEMFDRLEGFDTQTFFMYCDDLDFSWRLRLLGKKIYYRPDCQVFHSKTLSASGKWQPTKAEIFYSAQAAMLMAYKWSADGRLAELKRIYKNSGEPSLQSAVEHFEKMRKEGTLPARLDPKHTVARFVGDFYTEHRFSL